MIYRYTTMKQCNLILLVLASAAFVLSGCSSPSAGGASYGRNGEIIGSGISGSWVEPTPLGMVKVPSGSFLVNPGDEDPNGRSGASRTVSIDPFWMDDTEITNGEYRQFTSWVRDSIARKLLSESAVADADLFLRYPDGDETLDPIGIDNNQPILWNDPEYAEALEEMYIPEQERFFGKKEIDTRKLTYQYSWIDLRKAAKRSNSYNYETKSYRGGISDRSAFVVTSEPIYIYPDTLCWIRDFSFSYNEPLTKKYFSHPGYADYPVVGVTWEQAKAFCKWRSDYLNQFLASVGEAEVFDYRLPTEIEWEYAARGGLINIKYPWGGYYTTDLEGNYLANFKPRRGNLVADGALRTQKVGHYIANDYGLYDMAGNVAEWTITAYNTATYGQMSDFNPNFEYNASPDDSPAMKRKVVRGGSWKDISYFIEVSTRDFEYQDTATCFVGFRTVRDAFGDDL